MPLERDAIEAALVAKGFRRHDADHRKFHFWTAAQKKTPIWTKTSHGTKYKVLSDELVSLMAKQVALTTKEFVRFVSCEVSQLQYEALLTERKRL